MRIIILISVFYILFTLENVNININIKKTRILELNTSRALSKLLRHKAPEREVPYDKHGGVTQTNLLSLPEFKEPDITWDFIEKLF